MKDNKLINQVAQKIAQSANNSATTAGHSKSAQPAGQHRQADRPLTPERIETLNQVFELFRINYHNQYFAAFGNVETLNHAKRLWLETLNDFDDDAILQGAKRAIQESDYLPTLHKMINFCQGSAKSHGLAEAHQAFLEACRAPSPKASYSWSHIAVYHAGRESDWYFLANNPERVTFPIFKDNYNALCRRVMAGETLAPADVKRLAETIETPLSKDENLARLQALRDAMDL